MAFDNFNVDDAKNYIKEEYTILPGGRLYILEAIIRIIYPQYIGYLNIIQLLK